MKQDKGNRGEKKRFVLLGFDVSTQQRMEIWFVTKVSCTGKIYTFR